MSDGDGADLRNRAPRLRESVQTHGRGYVLAVSSTTPIWRERPPVEEPGPSPRGRPRTKVRLAPDASAPTTVSTVVSGWLTEQWERFSVAKGEVGFDHYEVRFWPSWHRHITLVMMAHAWLASVKATEAQKGGPFPPTWQH